MYPATSSNHMHSLKSNPHPHTKKKKKNMNEEKHAFQVPRSFSKRHENCYLHMSDKDDIPGVQLPTDRKIVRVTGM